jgi:hypothetical protein
MEFSFSLSIFRFSNKTENTTFLKLDLFPSPGEMMGSYSAESVTNLTSITGPQRFLDALFLINVKLKFSLIVDTSCLHLHARSIRGFSAVYIYMLGQSEAFQLLMFVMEQRLFLVRYLRQMWSADTLISLSGVQIHYYL